MRLKSYLLVAVSASAAQATKRTTLALPIVFIAGDPVVTGLVASLARPGGNVTGLSLMAPERGGK